MTSSTLFVRLRDDDDDDDDEGFPSVGMTGSRNFLPVPT